MQLQKGMTALVTGGVSGLGEASAVALLERGLNVVAVDLNEERGAAMEKEYAGRLKFVKADVADAEQMAKDSTVAHERQNAWTARKEQWRKERAEGKVDTLLKPETNDRPEFVPGAA